jgi:putative ABC transport system permease protein
MHWLHRLFRKDQAEKQLDAELRDHLDGQISDYIAAGISPEEARRRARLDFGGLESIKQQTRESRRGNFLETLFLDLRYAIRNLRKDRRFAMVAIFALALGIGASTVVFSIFYNLFFNAFAARDASRLVVPVIQNTENTGRADSNLQPLTFPLADLDVIREQNQVFENIVGYMPGAFVLANDGSQMYQFNGTRVTSDAFDFYGVPPLLGRGITPEDGNPGALPVFVMSYKTWKGVFNEDAKILGKILTIDGEPRTLVGVMPQRFQAYGLQAEIWIPVTRSRDAPRTDEESKATVLARLKSGITIETASADLDVIVRRLALLHPDDFPKHFAARVQSATDSLLGPQGGATTFHSDMKHLLYDLLAAVAMLLLIACSNVANLLLARATVREKEMAVRSALGATRGRLVRQLLAESSVLAMVACILGCLFAWLGMKFVPAIIPRTGDIYGGGHLGIETGVGLNTPVFFFALALAILTTLICGLAPALRVARTDVQPQLAGTGNGVNGAFHQGKLRAALVVAEVALAIVLLIGTGLMMRSFFLLTHVDLGFNPKNVLFVVFAPHTNHDKTSVAPLQKFASPQGLAQVRDIAERLKNLPGVAHVSIEDAMPGYSPSRGYKVSVPGATRTEEVGLFACDENLVPTLELRMVQGHWLSESEVRTAQRVGVISQRLANDYFGDANPIGQQLQVKAFKGPSPTTQDAEFRIIGVVKDIVSAGPQQPTMPMIFLPYTVRGGFFFLLKTTVEPASLAHTVRDQVWAVDRNEIVLLTTPLEDFLQRFTYATPEFGLLICTPLASVALLLVVIGVFSVMAYTVSLQTHEIGVRMALGAQQGNILNMVLAKGAHLLAAGILLGIFASYGLTRFLTSQIWGVSATDPWTFTAVAALVVAAGLGACFLPARRATRVDPLVALHYE